MDRRGEVSVLLTFSSCCSSRAGSCDSCSRTPAGNVSLPPPAARRTALDFCCCFFAGSSFVFPFFPFFPFSSLFDPADCGYTQRWSEPETQGTVPQGEAELLSLTPSSFMMSSRSSSSWSLYFSFIFFILLCRRKHTNSFRNNDFCRVSHPQTNT